ncbi:hypothetical protein M427DRAFT_53022 [Gonapodya prolifera JEL478]|uniref:CMP/dCMP-type deaminase domain-containing protein n=1 Tax=Gonapodya prolifera (strain JEL478) TaxID=1344416 RepID=A0A139ASA6_GONPJ|nr:hypothetical protein M427DRAFT_53022 [Gonapodya prolifera JEL478]|eukprot:KXS19617.1 hypothetical protein M427DRAFT_53022 [Gonapodya prolifera JEL478]
MVAVNEVILPHESPEDLAKLNPWLQDNTSAGGTDSRDRGQYHKPVRSLSKSSQEVHAEAYCLALCARTGRPTYGTTLYITFPPCNQCFMTAAVAGVQRIVFRRQLDPGSRSRAIEAAKRMGIELVEGDDRERDSARLVRVREYWDKALPS